MADAVAGAKVGQSVPHSNYNIEHMLNRMLAGGGCDLLSGECMNARRMLDAELLIDAQTSSMDEPANAPLAVDEVIAF